MFKGCGTALVTPFKADLSVDELCLRHLVRRQVEAGIHFLVPCGTTGESPTLSREEKVKVVEIVLEEANGIVPVIAGAGGYDTQEVVALAREYETLGVDGILSVAPYYNKPTQEGLFQHFKAIAEAVELPLILYNVPGRTVADLTNETILRLAQVPGIVGIKEASGDIGRAARLIKHAPAGFSIYSGDDQTAIALMLLGGKGNISVTANVAPRAMHELCMAAIEGRVGEARQIHLRLLELHYALFVEPSPAATKWALSRLGRCGSSVRLPITPLSASGQATVEKVLIDAGLIPHP